MISAFGVDHGEVSKAFKAVKPKLLDATAGMSSRGLQPTLGKKKTPGGMQGRTRFNYSVMRNNAGRPAEFNRMLGQKGRPSERLIQTARHEKAMANASVTAAGNLNRKQRHLP